MPPTIKKKKLVGVLISFFSLNLLPSYSLCSQGKKFPVIIQPWWLSGWISSLGIFRDSHPALTQVQIQLAALCTHSLQLIEMMVHISITIALFDQNLTMTIKSFNSLSWELKHDSENQYSGCCLMHNQPPP